MRTMLRVFTGHLGHDTAECPDGLAALEHLRELNDYDIALIDWDMPRLNGIELIRAIRNFPEFDGMKTLMVTAQVSIEKVAEALHAGADDYLMKPVDQKMLAEKLRLLGITSPVS